MDRQIDNHLLAILPSEEREWLEQRLQPTSQACKQELHDFRQQIRRIYFPLTSVVWLTRILADGKSAAVALVGKEGVVGLDALIDGREALVRAVVQVPGDALSIETSTLKNWALRHPVFHDAILHYANAFTSELMQSVICSRHHSVRQRYAKSLLQIQDRTGLDKLPLTQELLAATLGVRRNAVGEVAPDLQHEGAIRYHHGVVTVLDRTLLLEASCECYGEVLGEYER